MLENIPSLLLKRVNLNSHRAALMYKKRGQWVSLNWLGLLEQVYSVAAALREAGIGEGDRVALMSQSRWEWAVVDYAIMSLGAVSVPLYPTLSTEDVFEVLKDCGAKAVFVEDRMQLNKVKALRHELPLVKFIFAIDRQAVEEGVNPLPESNLIDAEDARYLAWKDRILSLSPDHLATIVYTSGTTGVSRGVALTHGNLLATLNDCSSVIEINENDLSLLFLPQSHILGRIEQMLPLVSGMSTAYAQSAAALFEDIVLVRPTLLFGVPKVFEQFHHAILRGVSRASWGLRLAQEEMLGLAKKDSLRQQRGQKLSFFSKLRGNIMDRSFLSELRERLGGRLRFGICGGAALGIDTATFFHSIGCLILEGYGLTESSGPVFVNRPEDFRFGSVGKALPSVEAKLNADGEVFLKGPSLMKGYWGENAHEGVFEGEWFKTGDLGRFDDRGFLEITGRKKEIIVLSTGKNVSPAKIESKIKSDPLFEHVVLAGEAKSYLVALLSLNRNEALKQAMKARVYFSDYEELLESAPFNALVGARIDQMNRGLAPFEMIRRFAILKRELSVEAGELTATQKMRRSFCVKKYSRLIEKLYSQ